MASLERFSNEAKKLDFPVLQLIIKYYYFNDKLQILLAETKDNKTGSRELTEKVWAYNPQTQKVDHQKFINGSLTVSEVLDSGYGKPDEIAEFQDIPDNFDSSNVQTMGLGDCINSGTCCDFFGAPPYNHCGKYCGNRNSAGGGEPINTCDLCCKNHDSCLASRSEGNRCYCDELLNHCLYLNSCPGDTIMGIGIRAAAAVAPCNYEEWW